MQILEKVTQFIISMPGNTTQTLGLQDSLVGSGILDSISVLDLVEFLESEFAVQLQPEEMEMANFENLASIQKMVVEATQRSN